jgi:hypothetical protein
VHAETQRSESRQREFGQAQLAIPQEEAMNGSKEKRFVRKTRVILPAVLRITLALALFGVGSMRVLQAQPKNHRVVKEYPVNRGKVESLQRWVNAGHDTWCRNPESVASATLQRLAPESAGYEYELASQTVDRKNGAPMKAVYTFHSLDGQTIYRITLRRHRWLLPTAGSAQEMIWLPERTEIITIPTLN